MSGLDKAGINIHAADAGSLTQMAALHAASFDEAWGEAALSEILAMPGAFALVVTACDDEQAPQLLGFVLARVAADEAEILSVAVDISHRAQGVGRKLMEAAAATAIASGAVSLFLEVADDNLSALALYERLGFVTVGLRPAYYARGATRVAARTMRMDLAKA
jgi:ribosomal-protein-alanine N-acetyltransferase